MPPTTKKPTTQTPPKKKGSTGRPNTAKKNQKEEKVQLNGAGTVDQTDNSFLYLGKSPADKEKEWVDKINELIARKKNRPEADQFTPTLQMLYDDLLKELCFRCGETFKPMFKDEEDGQSDGTPQPPQTKRDTPNNNLEKEKELEEKLSENVRQMKEIQEAKEKTEQQLSRVTEDNLKLKDQMEKLNKEIDQKRNENIALEQKLSKVEARLSESEKHKQESSISVKAVDANDLQVRVSSQEKMLAEKDEKITVLQNENRKLQKQINDTNSTLNDAENNVAKLKKDIENNRIELEGQTAKRKALENENSDLQKKLEDFNSSIDKLKAQNIAQGKSDSSNKEQIVRLTGENEKLKTKEKELRTVVMTREKDIQKFQEANNILKAEKESLDTVVKEIKSQVGQEVDQHSKKSESLSQNLMSKEHEILDLKRTKSEINRNNASLQKQVDELTATMKRLEDEKGKLKKEKKFASKPTDQKVNELQEENNKLRDRLSQIAGNKLTQGNPAITDLGDPNRPTLLGEKFSELYDNEWTDAMEELGGNDEKSNINTLKTIVEKAYEFGKIRSANFAKGLEKALLELGNSIEVTDVIGKYIKDHRKNISLHVTDGLYKSFIGSHTEYNIGGEGVKNFIKKSVSLCWLMAIQDPPVILTTKLSGKFDTDRFRHYTKSGSTVDYVVWPVVYLHEGGPIICKGVAQGK